MGHLLRELNLNLGFHRIVIILEIIEGRLIPMNTGFVGLSF